MIERFYFQEIEVRDGSFHVPKQFALSPKKKTLKIRTAWCTEINRLCKDGVTVSIQKYFRNKKKFKPFIPEGFIEFDDHRYKIREVD